MSRAGSKGRSSTGGTLYCQAVVPFEKFFTRDSIDVSKALGRDFAVLQHVVELGATKPQEGLHLSREKVRLVREFTHG